MKGFDQEALDFVLNAIEAEGSVVDLDLMRKVVQVAMEAELDYMKRAGIVNAKGEYTDQEYDEDEAFDHMIDALTKALPDKDPYQLSDLLDYYIDFHDEYMQNEGLLEWV